MKLKHVVAAVALAASGASMAATDLTLSVYDGTNYGAFLSGEGDTTFKFTLDDVYDATAILSISLTGAGVSNPVVSIKLDGANFVQDVDVTSAYFGYYVYSKSQGGLVSGDHFITVDLLDPAPGKPGVPFSGSLTLDYVGGTNPTPVPEPESYALALAGLGVVGMLSRRRKAA